MKFEVTLKGTVEFERTITVFAMNEEDAATIAREMFCEHLAEADEVDLSEIYVESDELEEELCQVSL